MPEEENASTSYQQSRPRDENMNNEIQESNKQQKLMRTTTTMESEPFEDPYRSRVFTQVIMSPGVWKWMWTIVVIVVSNLVMMAEAAPHSSMGINFSLGFMTNPLTTSTAAAKCATLGREKQLKISLDPTTLTEIYCPKQDSKT